MIAMQMTDYELGKKSPADLFAKPAPPSSQKADARPRPKGRGDVPPLAEEERDRRRRLLNRAIAKAGRKTELAGALGVGASTVSRWAQGVTPIHDEPLAKILGYLGEGEAPGLRRGHGVEWCPTGAHYVPEGKMRVNEGGTVARLTTCRDCQVRGDGPKSSREVQAELEGKC